MPSTNTSTYTQAELLTMREWLKECADAGIWDDMEPDDIDELTDAEVVRGVRRYYGEPRELVEEVG